MLGARLGEELADVFKAFDRVEDRLPFVVDHEELGEALLVVSELQTRTNALLARVGSAARVNGTAMHSGQRSVGQYVAARTNRRAVDIDRAVRRARWLRDFPIFEAAHGATLADDHVDYLKKHCDADFDMHCKLVGDQQFFIDTAATCSFEGFVEACDYWKIHIDPDGKEPVDQIEKSRLSIRKGSGGRGLLDGECDAITRLELETAVEHEAEKLRREDKANNVERSDSQRRMAALANLVKRGFARADGSFPVPLGNIVMSQKVAEWALATLAGSEPGDTVPVHPTDVNGRCELIDGTPIHPFLAVVALGLAGPGGTIPAANLRRYILDADSRLLDVSVNARSFPEWMRTAALVQSRGRCATHGCDNPHHWLQIDHVQPVAAGGETRPDNADPLCWPDNHAKAATTGHIPWRDKTPPQRRKPRPRGTTNNDSDDSDDDSDDTDHRDRF